MQQYPNKNILYINTTTDTGNGKTPKQTDSAQHCSYAYGWATSFNLLNFQYSNRTITAGNSYLIFVRREIQCEHTSSQTCHCTNTLVVIVVIENLGFIYVAATCCNISTTSLLIEKTKYIYISSR